jgi:hypothetical protein
MGRVVVMDETPRFVTDWETIVDEEAVIVEVITLWFDTGPVAVPPNVPAGAVKLLTVPDETKKVAPDWRVP